ncbi:MAG: lactonase family protein, partial [Chloroflexi bacterium]|nr:lactonase family protein [Chloroflexota bacterium]
MFLYVGAITSTYVEPKPPLYERPAPVPREGNMGEEKEGISVFHLDEESGALRHIQGVRGLRNPTYLALHPTLPILYAAERETTAWGPVETIAGAISSFAVSSEGTLSPLGREPAPAGGTYISFHPSGSHLFSAMPGAEGVCAFPVRPDGALQPPSALVQHKGRGVNTITLERPFPHSIRPDIPGRRVFSCDMGLDRLMVYDFDASTGRLEPAPHPYAQLSSGAGPRHLWVHPSNRFVYTVNEISATVSAFAYDPETSALRIVETLRTCPDDFTGHNSGAQIVVHPNGRFMYSSNRGHNSIAIYSLDEDTGRPRLLGLEPTQGDTPRNFNIDASGRFLVVAN